ncbi:hypothetical protein HPB50_006425 [Hyalomma asiaticum]|uniref:Uncharacterized protein n=1 Tax=Hyalomma asiaticum TaxID=266040 RepID=A0ACB7S709_HYAAI|nr:hypothetical protein HPB50_006425 [Hyalomma asiaticum]
MEPGNFPPSQVPHTPPGDRVQAFSTAPGLFTSAPTPFPTDTARGNILPGSAVHAYYGMDPVPASISAPEPRDAVTASLLIDVAAVDAGNAACSSSGSRDTAAQLTRAFDELSRKLHCLTAWDAAFAPAAPPSRPFGKYQNSADSGMTPTPLLFTVGQRTSAALRASCYLLQPQRSKEAHSDVCTDEPSRARGNLASEIRAVPSKQPASNCSQNKPPTEGKDAWCMAQRRFFYWCTSLGIPWCLARRVRNARISQPIARAPILAPTALCAHKRQKVDEKSEGGETRSRDLLAGRKEALFSPIGESSGSKLLRFFRVIKRRPSAGGRNPEAESARQQRPYPRTCVPSFTAFGATRSRRAPKHTQTPDQAAVKAPRVRFAAQGHRGAAPLFLLPTLVRVSDASVYFIVFLRSSSTAARFVRQAYRDAQHM